MSIHFSMHYGIYNIVDRINITSFIIKIIHNYTLCLIYFILVVVIFFFILIFTTPSYLRFNNNSSAEFIWTIIPLLLLFSIRIPSFTLLYSIESKQFSDLTYKAIRHQWYWSYESNDIIELNFDSYIINKVKIRDNRLLEVDNILNLPFNSLVQIIITSEDVLHSWALPNLRIKVDAVPRRLNSIGLSSIFPGKFYRQCSEICRINHSFIPISIEFLSWKDFFNNLYWSVR